MPLPDEGSVPEDFANAMEWNGPRHTLCIRYLKRQGILFAESHLLKRNPNDRLLEVVLVSNLEGPFSKLFIPANSIEQFLNRYHPAEEVYIAR